MPQVRVTNADGDPAQNVSVSVTTIAENGPNKNYSSETTNTGGVAVFDDIVINEAATYYLKFSIDSSSPAVETDNTAASREFVVEAASSASIVADGVTFAAGENESVTVTVTDQYGNESRVPPSPPTALSTSNSR